MAGLHYHARQTSHTGSYSLVVMELNGLPDAAVFRDALNQISARLPMVHGWTKRDFRNLAPYWHIPKSPGRANIPLTIVDASDDATADRLLSDHVNATNRPDREHLNFLLVRIADGTSRIGVVFDHRMLDAIGAETFLRLIDLTVSGQLEEYASKVKQEEPPHLDVWEKQFAGGKTVFRRMKMIGQRDVCAMAMPPAGRFGRVHFAHEHLTTAETTHFLETASEECGGMPIVLPSAAARAVYAMRAAVPNPPLPGTQHTLFTTASMRTNDQQWEQLFFNHFSFLLLTVGTEVPQSLPDLATATRDSFFDQMKEQIPQSLADAAALSRVSPRWLNQRFNYSMFKGRVCSLYFACLRDGGYKTDTFLGVPIANLYHKPLAFGPPGLNLCMTTFGGRFNLVLSYLEGVMNDTTAATLMRTFKAALLRQDVERHDAKNAK